MIFYFFAVFVFFGGTLKIAVLPAWELNSGEVDLHFLVFLCFLEMLKKHVFRQGRFFTFFHDFWCLLGGLLAFFWGPFGAPVVSLACWRRPFGCLWLAWAVCGPSLLLFVVPLARLGCLWARGPLRDRFLLHFRFMLVSFFEQFGVGF